MMNVLILGGGYAGLTTALGLAGADAQVTLVNRHTYHYLTTMLHQPAVGSRHYQDIHVDVPGLLKPPLTFIRGKVAGIDAAVGKVTVMRREGAVELAYDILVVALGWEPQFFDIPGLKEHAVTLESLNHSRLARDRIEESLLALDDAPEETWRSTIVIGGGGLTGVELAGELIDSRNELVRGLDMKAGQIRLVMIEGGKQILAGLDERLSQRTRTYLESHGVEIITGKRIERCDEHSLTLSDGTGMDYGVLFWTGGVRGNHLLTQSRFPVLANGRVPVNERLQHDLWPNFFFVGDCAAGLGTDGRPLPPTAWLAVQHGRYVAENIRRTIAGVPLTPFVPQADAIVLSLGHRYALGVMGGRLLSGSLAAMVKDFLAFRYIFQIGGLGLTLRKLFQWTPYLVHLHRDIR